MYFSTTSRLEAPLARLREVLFAGVYGGRGQGDPEHPEAGGVVRCGGKGGRAGTAGRRETLRVRGGAPGGGEADQVLLLTLNIPSSRAVITPNLEFPSVFLHKAFQLYKGGL